MSEPRIKPIGQFHTPSSREELEKHINRYSGPERAVAIVVMGMTWNYLAAVVNEKPDRPWERNHQNPYANINPDEEEDV